MPVLVMFLVCGAIFVVMGILGVTAVLKEQEEEEPEAHPQPK